MTPQGKICQFCRAVLIDPILSFDDERLAPPSRLDRWRAYLKELEPLNLATMPIDYILIGAADALNEPWPDYIQQVAEKYNGNPPHVNQKWGLA
jgi:hypothetical protein